MKLKVEDYYNLKWHPKKTLTPDHIVQLMYIYSCLPTYCIIYLGLFAYLFPSVFAVMLTFLHYAFTVEREFKQLLCVYVCLCLYMCLDLCVCVHVCVCTGMGSKQGTSVRSFVLQRNVDFTFLVGFWLKDYG